MHFVPLLVLQVSWLGRKCFSHATFSGHPSVWESLSL